VVRLREGGATTSDQRRCRRRRDRSPRSLLRRISFHSMLPRSVIP